MMNVSVLIPSRARADKLCACLGALSAQEWLAGDEVVVGLDGPDDSTAARARSAFHSDVCDFRLFQRPQEGYIALRSALAHQLRGDVLVSMNDDVIPEAGFIGAHRRACTQRGSAAAFVGYSPFVPAQRPTIIDRLVAETSWVFFYDAMHTGSAPDHDFGFRHLFGLNFSARLDMVRRVGGFTPMPNIYGYDDIELGYRLQNTGCSINFLHEARAPHDHRMTAPGLLQRERMLGRSACHYARACPAFAREVFGRDIIEPTHLSQCTERLEREREACASLERAFERLGEDTCEDADVDEVYARFRPLKKHCWRQGLITEAARLGLVSTWAAA